MPLSLAAQTPAERRLAGPVTRLSHDFASITSVGELRDGRVLVTDPRGDLFAVADFARDEVTAVGRKGRGPGEYDRPAPIIRLGGDSSLMAIAASRRWLLLDGARIVSTLPADAPAVRLGLFLRGADSLGDVLVSVSPRPDAFVASPESTIARWRLKSRRGSFSTGGPRVSRPSHPAAPTRWSPRPTA